MLKVDSDVTQARKVPKLEVCDGRLGGTAQPVALPFSVVDRSSMA